MARLPRYTVAGQPQHVIQRGNNRSRIFAARADYIFFRECVRAACSRHGCQVHAYVLMTNHVHLLMTPSSTTGIGKVMQSLGGRYVKYFNLRYERTGGLWEGRYRATPIQTERYLLACYRYIELNPVRAGIAERPEDYPWSSHHANAFGRADSLVTSHERYRALGREARKRQASYRELFAGSLEDATLREIRRSTNKGWALGDEQFRDEIAAVAGRRARPSYKGGARADFGDRKPGGDLFLSQWGQTPLKFNGV